MKTTEFRRRIAATNMHPTGRIAQALLRIMVSGETAYRVCKELKIDQAQISRARKLLLSTEPADNCPRCGNQIR